MLLCSTLRYKEDGCGVTALTEGLLALGKLASLEVFGRFGHLGGGKREGEGRAGRTKGSNCKNRSSSVAGEAYTDDARGRLERDGCPDKSSESNSETL